LGPRQEGGTVDTCQHTFTGSLGDQVFTCTTCGACPEDVDGFVAWDRGAELAAEFIAKDQTLTAADIHAGRRVWYELSTDELRAELQAETIRADRMRDQRDEAKSEMHRWKAVALQLQAREARRKTLG
jgi:hypothetical protein